MNARGVLLNRVMSNHGLTHQWDIVFSDRSPTLKYGGLDVQEMAGIR